MNRIKIIFLGLGLLIIGSSCKIESQIPKPYNKKEEVKPITLQEKKIAMIIANSDFRDEEYEIPKQILEQAGAEVTTVSSSLKLARGMLGTKAKVDLLLSAVEVDKFDAIIFVGGIGAKEYWDNSIAHKIAQASVRKGKVLGAICIAPVILAKAGILQGKKATVFPQEKDKLEQKGVIYTGISIQKDGYIITAQGPKEARAFGEAIKELLEVQGK